MSERQAMFLQFTAYAVTVFTVLCQLKGGIL